MGRSNTIMLQQLMLVIILYLNSPVVSQKGLGLQNAGKECWKNCDKTEGKCGWCGPNGYCCRRGWTGNGCDGHIGGHNFHACAALGLENAGNDCWHGCNKLQGKCSFCGPNGYCCRKGFEGSECDGSYGGHNFHACVLRGQN